jgi:hypothetical protein
MLRAEAVAAQTLDEVIRKCRQYNSYPQAIRRAAKMTGLSVEAVVRRAVALGLPGRERCRWTEPELETLETYAHASLDKIQEQLDLVSPPGVTRTRSAIVTQMQVQRFRQDSDGLYHAQLANALGIRDQTLHRFRIDGLITGADNSGLIRTLKPSALADARSPWFYKSDDIVRFLIIYPGEIDLGKVDKVWFMTTLEAYVFRTNSPEFARQERARARKRQNGERLPPIGDPVYDAIRAGKKAISRVRRLNGVARASRPGTSGPTGISLMQNGSAPERP